MTFTLDENDRYALLNVATQGKPITKLKSKGNTVEYQLKDGNTSYLI